MGSDRIVEHYREKLEESDAIDLTWDKSRILVQFLPGIETVDDLTALLLAPPQHIAASQHADHGNRLEPGCAFCVEFARDCWAKYAVEAED